MPASRSARRELELLGVFFTVAKQFEGQVAGELKRLGLSPPLADFLQLLEPGRPAPTMRSIAARLHCDPSSVTFLADRLAAKELVERAEDPDDRRAKIVRLTAEGARVRGALLAGLVEQSGLAALDADEQETLLALLGKIVAAQPAGDGPSARGKSC